jgi:carbon-monoxide dehydrogenase large subunit
MSILGTRVVRFEDPRFLTVGGTYVDDLREPALDGAAHVTYVRSTVAHGRITHIDTADAVAAPGVIGVVTGAEVDLPPGVAQLIGVTTDMPRPVLARDLVRYVGEPVAAIVTENRYQGEDAAELVSVDYEPLPAVVDLADALAGSTLLFPDTGSNVAATFDDGRDDTLFDGCEVVVSADIVNQRVAPAPMEVRSAAAAWGDDERLTFWSATQSAHGTRDRLRAAYDLAEEQVRVVAPDVGGGFGAKMGRDPEEVLLPWLARHFGRPMRWTENRSENLVGLTHGRAQKQTVTIGGRRDGSILAYRLEVVQDAGAYPEIGSFLPFLTRWMAPGVYDIPKVESRAVSVVTTTTPVAAYRGAGRPEATAAVERAVDLFAAEIGMDPADVRRRNLVGSDAFPYTTRTGLIYDSGDYRAALDRVLEAGGYQRLRDEQRRRRESGDTVQLGIGLATYVEITAGDSYAGEHAQVDIEPDGRVRVLTGSSAHGQGHATSWAMIVADQLGVPLDAVTVIYGDTDLVPQGVGTFGSRSLQLGGTAVHDAAVSVLAQARDLAADLLEASADDVVLDRDSARLHVAGDASSGLSWSELAAAAAGREAVLSASSHFVPQGPTFPFGAHLAVVEVDTGTGKVTLRSLTTVDDAGRILNPLLVEGQRHGGLAQGVAQALVEEMRYDADGNPVTTNFADYGIVTADLLPSFDLVDSETPTPYNPLGAKGIGEAGTIGATPAVQNAVIDAVAHLGVRHIDLPTTSERVWRAITEASAQRGTKNA